MAIDNDALPAQSPFHRGPLWQVLQWLFQAFFCFWLGYRAVGYKRLQQQDGALILANHQSFLDPLLVGLPLHRPISFLARHSLFPVPVVGWVLKRTYVLPINQQAAGAASLRDLVARLQAGWLVGVFPEGTRSETGAIGELKPGFTTLVRRARKPIIPVGIAGAYQALPLGSWFLKPTRVRVVFGPPISVEDLENFPKRDQEAALLDLVRAQIVRCHDAAEAWRATGKLPAGFEAD